MLFFLVVGEVVEFQFYKMCELIASNFFFFFYCVMSKERTMEVFCTIRMWRQIVVLDSGGVLVSVFFLHLLAHFVFFSCFFNMFFYF